MLLVCSQAKPVVQKRDDQSPDHTSSYAIAGILAGASQFFVSCAGSHADPGGIRRRFCSEHDIGEEAQFKRAADAMELRACRTLAYVEYRDLAQGRLTWLCRDGASCILSRPCGLADDPAMQTSMSYKHQPVGREDESARRRHIRRSVCCS